MWAYHCVQLPYTTQHRTVLIIFALILQTIIAAQTSSFPIVYWSGRGTNDGELDPDFLDSISFRVLLDRSLSLMIWPFLLVLLPVIITVHLKANLKLTCLPPSWPPSASVSFYQRIWRYINLYLYLCLFVLVNRSSSDGSRFLHLPATDAGEFADVRLPVEPRDRVDRLRVGADAVVGGRSTRPDRPAHALRLRRRPPASRRRRRHGGGVVDPRRRRRRRRLGVAHLPGVRGPARARLDGQVAARRPQRHRVRRRRAAIGRLRVRRQQGRRRSGTSRSRRLRSTLPHRVRR